MHTPSHKATPRTPGGGGGNGGGGGASAFSASASKNVHSMRTQKAASTKAQGRTLFKPTMATPFQTPWNPLTLEQSHQALTLLTEGLRASVCSSPAAPIAAVASPTASTAPKATTGKRKRDSNAETTDDSAGHPAISGVCIGINAVTRAATAGTLSLVVVCRSVAPVLLISHLPILCQLKQTPLLTLHPHINTRMLAQVIEDATKADGPTAPRGRRLRLCTTIGIQRDSMAATVSALQPLASIPALRWLGDVAAVPPRYEAVRVLHTGGDDKKPQHQGKGAQKPPKGAAKAQSAEGTATGAPTPKPAMGQRIESATQRKKKQKQQHQAGQDSSMES